MSKLSDEYTFEIKTSQTTSNTIERKILKLCLLLLFISASTTVNTFSQNLSSRVLIVYNPNISQSVEVAQHYKSQRNIPQSNLCAITPSDEESISWNEFNTAVKTPIRNCIDSIDPSHQNITYVVFSYRLPFKIDDPIPSEYTWAGVTGRALDTFLIDLWDSSGVRVNPYFVLANTKNGIYQARQSLTSFNSSRGYFPIYSVWRMDGPSISVAKGLVDKAKSAESTGLIGNTCVDRNRGLFDVTSSADSGYLQYDWDMLKAAEFAREKGFYTIEDPNEAEFGTSPAPARCDNAALYVGWYSLNNYNDAFTWANGAIGYHLDSASAPNPRTGTNWVKNALERGITATMGSVDEPFAHAFSRSDQLFRNLFQGANVGDAFLRSMEHTDWQLICIGDPLYRPFPGSTFPPGNSPLPSPWVNQDIGSIAVSGRADYYNGNFSIQSSGVGFYGEQDAFHFAHQSLSGDGVIIAQISRPEYTDYSSSARIMIRENLSANSSFASIGITTDGGAEYKFVARTTQGGFASGVGNQVSAQFPHWVKLVRQGNLFSGYHSTNGTTWQLLNSTTIAMSSNVYVGLAVTEGSNSTRLNKSFFSDVVVSNQVTADKTFADFDGDGRADISVFRPSAGAWYIDQSSSGFTGVAFGISSDIIAPADYDNDGKTDIAVFRPSNGAWYLQRSSFGFTAVTFGQNGDIPVQADYDGDSKADIAVWRPSSGNWYYIKSSDGSFFSQQFGQNGDKPSVGDFDGDGKSDLAVFRPSNGYWYRINSSTGSLSATLYGDVSDRITPADYDGDGKTDIAVFRPSNGTWYGINSGNGQSFGIAFGTNGDIPVPADYDNDGKADFGVFRPSNGIWYLSRSNEGGLTQPFGLNGDVPIPSTFVR